MQNYNKSRLHGKVEEDIKEGENRDGKYYKGDKGDKGDKNDKHSKNDKKRIRSRSRSRSRSNRNKRHYNK